MFYETNYYQKNNNLKDKNVYCYDSRIIPIFDQPNVKRFRLKPNQRER